MTKSIATGYTDTAIGGFTDLSPSLAILNWGQDLVLQSDSPEEKVYTNVTAPVDQPETIRLAQRKVANVYAGTDIDPSAFLPTRLGTSTLVEVRETWAETSSTDETYRKLIPVRCGISFTLPAYGNLTAAQAQALALRTVAALFERASSNTDGMTNLLRGVLTKKTS